MHEKYTFLTLYDERVNAIIIQKGVIFMTEKQEYIKFWSSIRNKCDEVQKDYNNLSNVNKQRVDNVRDMIFHANTISDILNIISNQQRY